MSSAASVWRGALSSEWTVDNPCYAETGCGRALGSSAKLHALFTLIRNLPTKTVRLGDAKDWGREPQVIGCILQKYFYCMILPNRSSGLNALQYT